MSRVQIVSLLLATLFAVVCVMLGCGGGGGGSNSGGPLPGLTRVESVITASPAVVRDSMNFMVGDQVTFELVNYDSNGVRTVLSGQLWSSTDINVVSGTLDPGTGNFIALASTNGTTYVVSTVFQGNTYSLPYLVTPVQSRISGRVMQEFSAFGVSGIKIVFYDASSNVVGQGVTSSYDGTFLASVPTTAARFNLVPASINTSFFYREFAYDGISGSTGGTSTGSNTSTTLKDTSGNWAANETTGHVVSITSGTGNGQSRTIASNTQTQLTVGIAWATIPDATSVYSIDTLRYTPTPAACSAPLPAGLAVGVKTILPSPVYLSSVSFPPPPAPDGCP